MHHGISPSNVTSTYAPVHPHDMMLMKTTGMITSAVGSDSLSSSTAASPRDSMDGGTTGNPTGTDDEADDDDDDDDICHDFSKVLRVREMHYLLKEVRN